MELIQFKEQLPRQVWRPDSAEQRATIQVSKKQK
jgi:hypothetical protein